MYHPDLIRHPDGCPALVLNADYTPLSYYPLSLWPWQTAVKAVFLERVDIVSNYEREVHSPTTAMKLPSVIALRQYVRPSQHPAFTRFNLFLRDRFVCQYCGSPHELTFDHVIPRAQGGRTTWENVATACAPCNLRKGGRTPRQARMTLAVTADPPDQLAAPGTRPPLPAQLSPPELARLALLGCRAGRVRPAHSVTKSASSNSGRISISLGPGIGLGQRFAQSTASAMSSTSHSQ